MGLVGGLRSARLLEDSLPRFLPLKRAKEAIGKCERMVESPAITAEKSRSEGLNSAIPTVGSTFGP